MTETPITVSEALDDALDFACDAWREAWAPMLLTAFGWALLIVAGHGQVSDAFASVAQKLGLVLLLFHLPLLGALYRLALGGAPLRGLGPGGLQIGGVEWRVLAVNAVFAFFFLLACLPAFMLSGLLYLLLRRFDGVTLGPLGHWEWWFLVAALFWLALIGALIYASGRLSLATAYSIERRRILPWESWPMTFGEARIIILAFLAAHAPTLLVWLALQAFGWIELGATPVGLHGAWPLPEAVGAGVLAGLVLAAFQAPLSVGLLTFFYDMLAPADVAPDLGRIVEPLVKAEPDAALDPEPEIEPPFSTVEFSPHTGRFSRLASPWLAEEDVPEPYRRFSTPEREPQDEAPALAKEAQVEAEDYPHSIVEYSPHSGRFSRLFSPWLAQEEADGGAQGADRETLSAEFEKRDGVEGSEDPLDGAGEAEHADP